MRRSAHILAVYERRRATSQGAFHKCHLPNMVICSVRRDPRGQNDSTTDKFYKIPPDKIGLYRKSGVSANSEYSQSDSEVH